MRIMLPGILLCFLAACGPAAVAPEKGAEHYFQQGEIYFEKGLYQDAIAAWEKVRESYYSPDLSTLAQLKIAEAHFLAKEYHEAAAIYDEFLKQNQGDARAPQVLFQLGLAYYRQILDKDRDQTATRNALTAFNNFLTHYPDDPKAEEAKRIISDCREKMAQHELYVGRYYLRAGQPRAAIRRLEAAFSNFPEFSGREESYFYLGQAYLAAGQREAAEKTFADLGRDFPNSELAFKAHKLLDKSR